MSLRISQNSKGKAWVWGCHGNTQRGVFEKEFCTLKGACLWIGRERASLPSQAQYAPYRVSSLRLSAGTLKKLRRIHAQISYGKGFGGERKIVVRD